MHNPEFHSYYTVVRLSDFHVVALNSEHRFPLR